MLGLLAPLRLKALEDLRINLLALVPPQYDLPKSRNGEIKFNHRMRTCLGRAFTKSFKIELNAQVLLEDPVALEKTFAHELAHLVAVEIWGSQACGHGRYWRYIMKMFKQPPERLANNSAALALRKPHQVIWSVECGCGAKHNFKPRAYKAVQNGVRYRCGRCKKELPAPPPTLNEETFIE